MYQKVLTISICLLLYERFLIYCCFVLVRNALFLLVYSQTKYAERPFPVSIDYAPPCLFYGTSCDIPRHHHGDDGWGQMRVPRVAMDDSTRDPHARYRTHRKLVSRAHTKVPKRHPIQPVNYYTCTKYNNAGWLVVRPTFFGDQTILGTRVGYTLFAVSVHDRRSQP